MDDFETQAQDMYEDRVARMVEDVERLYAETYLGEETPDWRN